jgi:hypothetical protein
LLDTMRIVRDGALLSLVGSTYLLVLLRFNPRIFLRHYPKEIREIVPPKSGKERRRDRSESGAWFSRVIRDRFFSHESNPQLIHQRVGLQRVIPAFVSEEACGDMPQVRVNCADNPVSGRCISSAPVRQPGSDLLRLPRRIAHLSCYDTQTMRLTLLIV